MDFEKLLQGREQFVQQQLVKVEALGVVTKWMLIDHICVRVDSDQLYEALKKYLWALYPMLWPEKMIGWRNIAIFDLVNTYWRISHPYDTLFELPAPKPDHAYPNWLQHIELVYPWNIEDLLNKHPFIERDKDWYNKWYNRGISIMFPDKTEVKFHEQSLREVLPIEW